MKGNLNNRQANPFTPWGPKRTAVLARHTYKLRSFSDIHLFMPYLSPYVYPSRVFSSHPFYHPPRARCYSYKFLSIQVVVTKNRRSIQPIEDIPGSVTRPLFRDSGPQ